VKKMISKPENSILSEMYSKAENIVLPPSLGAFLEDKALLLGNKPAAVFFQQQEGINLTYKDLSELSNRIANALVGLGVRKGTHVAVMLPNIQAFLITWFGLAKIGAVIVPVNINYKTEELAYVLNDSDAQFLIIDEICCGTFNLMEHRPEVLTDVNVILRGKAGHFSWHNWDKLCEAGSVEFDPPTDVKLSDLCNIQYTSGTTGFPKGCMLSHEYWLLMAFTGVLFHNKHIENTLITFPFFYMEPLIQILLTFYYNGTAYIANKHSSTKFLDWIREYRIHYCAFPEIVLKNTPPSTDDANNELRYVSAFQYKGEIHFELEKRFNVIARDAFAMTEIGMGTVVPADATHMVGSGSCGLPAPFRELRIVGENGNDVERGEIGELWVAGPGMLWGYYKKPKANAESFYGKWFRTGDLFCQDDDGYYYVIGRIKEMIKRSGENISANEVEAVLEDMVGIQEAAVVPVPDEMRREEVKAYIVLKEGLTNEDLPPEKIFEHCAAKLSKFKIPRYLAYVNGFPRTPSNKIAKKRLIEESGDLRLGAFDRVDGIWR